MHLQREIYEKFTNGDSMRDDEIDAAIVFHKKLSDSLYKLGPTFELSAKESNRVYLAMEGFKQSRKSEKIDKDRLSASYLDGYETGLRWQRNDTPGGPWHYYAKNHEDDIVKRNAKALQENHRLWMLGWTEGKAAQTSAPKKQGK